MHGVPAAGRAIRFETADVTAFSQRNARGASRLREVPITLLQNVGDGGIAEDKSALFHRRRARSRRAGIRPLRRISASGISIFGPLAAATSSCLEIAEAAFFVLPDEFADVLAGCAPIAGGHLSFYIFLQRLGERDVERGHRHGFII